MRLTAIGILLVAAMGCGGSPAPQPQQSSSAATAAPAVLGPPATQAGTTMVADSGQIKPADPSQFNRTPGYSPYAGRNYPERVYFGDEHVHTAWSMDAGGSGATIGPEDAVRFARGEEAVAASGQPVKLGKPLALADLTSPRTPQTSRGNSSSLLKPGSDALPTEPLAAHERKVRLELRFLADPPVFRTDAPSNSNPRSPDGKKTS